MFNPVQDLSDMSELWRLAATELAALIRTRRVSATEVAQATLARLTAARFREDLCLAAGEAIEAGGVPAMPVDPVSA